ncbi:hypothetical protein BD324DRAFT_509600 [Kockovaella imperatae]|uniref:Fibronectin type-III domain-containing protein n=1 Tax=Kockovaella imperatae TaxID=4999 RepID=A0A1Y1UFQ2_9TREE|nr:hypothetical protein BD324DRAFT_509600 [Kockovaella imperatae]ORX35895.1 hypothetical protein BD324DRAFT_509600 [Kockovaella imperatae]
MAASSSQWHSINPHTRPLSLSILELTPLALTLSLTLAAPPSPSLHPSHSHQPHVAHTHNHAHGPKHKKKSRHKRHDSDDELTAVEVDDEGHQVTSSSTDLSNFKDLLSHGVVVSVNGQPWNRIVAHVNELEDEALEGEHEDQEEADWEDGEPDVEQEGSGMVQRRPRRARFTLSARGALHGEEGTLRRRRQSHGEKKDKIKLDKDQAVVVVYGLVPGTEYEIELQVLGLAGSEGEPIASNSVLLPASPASGSGARSRANSLLARSLPVSRSNSVSGSRPILAQPSEASPVSPERPTPPASNSDLPPTPIPTNILNPVDTQAAQIRHMVAAAHAEKDHLQSQIKEARRASQRAEAALRSEIETVKRAIDKAGALDLRAKQKALALQEQVKQGWAGAENAEQQAESLEKGMEALRSRFDDVALHVDDAKAEYNMVKAAEDEVREADRKVRIEEEKKLAEVVGKIDKLKLRKEKKEAEKAELEARLDELERQKEHEERRTVEEKYARRSSAYWWDPHVQNHGHGSGAHHHDHHANSRGSAGRGFQPRHPSYPVRPTHAQPSPTAASFQPNTSSPAFVPAALSGSPAPSSRTPSGSGVNVSAAPFQPSYETTLMPPQLQHRIYLPSERPRPSPTFNPPPSVMADSRSSPTTSNVTSSPSFPPLPGHSPSPEPTSSGPTLASIITRAVMSPTSAAFSGNVTPTQPRPSPPPSTSANVNVRPGAGLRTVSNPSSPVPYGSNSSNHSSGLPSRQTTFGPPPDRSDLSPVSGSGSGPWGSNHTLTGLHRTSTPPIGVLRSNHGRDSPLSPGGSSGNGRP